MTRDSRLIRALPHFALLALLRQDSFAYVRLLEEHDGHIDTSAHQLAAAKSHPHPPRPGELHCAAMEIATRTAMLDPVPTAEALAAMCEFAGLKVAR